jgi:hypothetical protein
LGHVLAFDLLGVLRGGDDSQRTQLAIDRYESSKARFALLFLLYRSRLSESPVLEANSKEVFTLPSIVGYLGCSSKARGVVESE